MTKREVVGKYLSAIALPAATLVFSALTLECVAPGIVARWLDLRVLVAAGLFLSVSGFAVGQDVASASSRRTSAIAVASVAVFAVAATFAVAGPGWRFLLFALFVTVIITFHVARKGAE
jgi:hypothetical protein